MAIKQDTVIVGYLKEYIDNHFNNIDKRIETVLKDNKVADVAAYLDDIRAVGNSIETIYSDLQKGNYFGNRKLDIDLDSNRASRTVASPLYTGVRIFFDDGLRDLVGTKIINNGSLITTSDGSKYYEFTFNTPASTSPDIKEAIVYNSDLFPSRLIPGNDNVANPDLILDTHFMNYDKLDDNPVLRDENGDIIEQDITEDSPDYEDLIIRIYDHLGRSSNIENIQLISDGNNVVTKEPIFFWADTTSALQTLAQRAGDVISLGNEIDNLILLANSIDELNELQTRIPELVDTYTPDINGDLQPNGDLTVYNKLTELIELYNNLVQMLVIYEDIKPGGTNYINAVGNDLNTSNNIKAVADDLNLGVDSNIIRSGENIENIISVVNNEDNINSVAANETNITTVSENIDDINNTVLNMDAIKDAPNQAQIAVDSANTAKGYSDQMTGLTVQVIELASTATATKSYDSATNTLTLGIPRGYKGDRGEAFKIDAQGILADRVNFNGVSAGFSFFANDTELLYFKTEDTVGDFWTTGTEFGKGEKGDKGDTGKGILGNIVKTNTTGLVDTYTITYTDATSSTFTVTRGKGIISNEFTSTTDASGLAGKSGATDTYTITYNDGTTNTYPVYNGIDGEVTLALLEDRLASFSSDVDCGGASSLEDTFLELGGASNA